MKVNRIYIERCRYYLQKNDFAKTVNVIAKDSNNDTNYKPYKVAMNWLFEHGDICKTNKGFELTQKGFKKISKDKAFKKLLEIKDDSFKDLIKKGDIINKMLEVASHLEKNPKLMDELLQGELGTIMLEPITKAKLKVKSKENIKKRIKNFNDFNDL